MFGMGRGGAASQLSEAPGYPGLASEGHQGSGEQHTSETPPHTPPNSLKMTASSVSAAPGLHMSTEANSYHGGHVQAQQPPHSLPYGQATSLGYNTSGLHDTSLGSLSNYEADDKSMVQYNNDSINNIYNGTNSRL